MLELILAISRLSGANDLNSNDAVFDAKWVQIWPARTGFPKENMKKCLILMLIVFYIESRATVFVMTFISIRLLNVLDVTKRQIPSSHVIVLNLEWNLLMGYAWNVFINNLMNARPCFRNLLCRLINKLISHGFLPHSMLLGITRPTV